MPNLSALIDKFLFRETLTTEEKTSIRDDIGAGTPATTDSVLALLDGETVPLDGLVLGDQGDIVQEEAGALIRNGNSLAISDAVNEGGSIIYDESRSFGSRIITTGGTAARLVLGTIRVPTRYAKVGTTIAGVAAFNVNTGFPANCAFGVVTAASLTPADPPYIGACVGYVLPESSTFLSLFGGFALDLVDNGDTVNMRLSTASNTPRGTFLKGSLATGITTLEVANCYNIGSVVDDTYITPLNESFLLYVVLDYQAGLTIFDVNWDITLRGQ